MNVYQAAVGAHGDVVKYLLSKGADVNALNKRWAYNSIWIYHQSRSGSHEVIQT